MFRKQKAPPFWRAAPVSITYTFLSRSFRKYYFYSGNKTRVIARCDSKGSTHCIIGYLFSVCFASHNSKKPGAKCSGLLCVYAINVSEYYDINAPFIPFPLLQSGKLKHALQKPLALYH